MLLPLIVCQKFSCIHKASCFIKEFLVITSTVNMAILILDLTHFQTPSKTFNKKRQAKKLLREAMVRSDGEKRHGQRLLAA